MGKGEQVIDSFWNVLQKRMLLNERKMKEVLRGYKPSEVHCIAYVGSHQEANVTRMAEAFRMTTGAITKLTKKMIEKELLESYKKTNNKKEIYFRLTAQGQAVFDSHAALHEEFRQRDAAVLAQIPDEQFDTMLHFATLYGQHLDAELQKQGINLQVDGCDTL